MNRPVGKGNNGSGDGRRSAREPGAARAACVGNRDEMNGREKQDERETIEPTIGSLNSLLFNRSSAALFHKWVWNSDNHSIVGCGCLSCDCLAWLRVFFKAA